MEMMRKMMMKRLKLEWDFAAAYVDGYHAAMGEPSEFVPGMLPDYLQKYWYVGYARGEEENDGKRLVKV